LVINGTRRSYLPAVCVLAIGAAIWFWLNQNGPYGPLVLGWIAPPAALALTALAVHRTASTAGLPTGARRFWNGISVVSATSAVGLVVQAAYALTGHGPTPARVPSPSGLVYLFSLGYSVWMLLRVPIGPRGRSEWARLWLDIATVMLGAAMLMWYIGFSPLLTQGSPHVVWIPLLVGVICLAGVFATIKIVLAGAGPVDPGALRLLGAGLVLGGISAGTASLVASQPYLVPAQVSVPLIAVLVVLAGQRQARAATTGRPGSVRARRTQLSFLPYTAVAATDVLLVFAVLNSTDARRYLVVAGTITVTALVVVRQVLAFNDNARLVNRLRQQEDQLRHQASHDGLTQLANRRLFADRLNAAFDGGSGAGGAGPSGALTVLLIDLDDFKSINDTLGHTVGDRVLTVVGERIRHCVRPGDTVARLGGDEFAVLLRQARPSAIDDIAGHILDSLSQPVVVDGYELLVQASIGVADARPGDDPETLLRNADIAMYAAKDTGKAAFVRYAPSMAARILEHARLGAQLRQALDDGQLHLLYQPVVRLADRHIIGMEALVRWRHPSHGLIAPVDFIPTAERTGLIVPLGRWVLREACRQKALWRKAYGDFSPATVGVNVSGRQLQEPRFADDVADAVHESGLEPHNLVLEVTETAVLTGGQSLETLHALRALGVKLALDDFGTGQSSLGLIRTCPVHILKLDKSFVADHGARADQQRAVATAVAHIANALGLDAVAEGIEGPEQAERVQKLGYRLGQGFHLARPGRPAEIDQLLARDATPPWPGQPAGPDPVP
jgi:diguanylate cyclase (GGDEF)-like protein